MRRYHHLVILLRLPGERRDALRTVRQLYIVVIGTRVEVRDNRRLLLVILIRVSVIDSRQLGVRTRFRLEQNLISRRARSVFGRHGDGRRSAAYRTIHDAYLRTTQFTTTERLGRTARVRQRTYTTICYDIGRNGCRTARYGIDLYSGVVRVKTLPLLAVNFQLVNLRRINQFDIIHIQRVSLVQTAIGTEVRVVGRREDDITFRRHIVVDVVNRNTDVGPVVVSCALTPPTFSHLTAGRLRLTLVLVQQLTDIRLLILYRHARTTTVLVLVLCTFRRTCP